MEVTNLTATEIAKAIKNKEVTAHQVMSAFLRNISEKDEEINAFVTVNNKALETAEKIDVKIKAGEKLGPLAGVPVAIKDMLCTRGLATTAGSKMLENYLPPYSATVVNRLESAGAIVIGKCNQDEFAMGSSSENSYFGVTRNPWNLERVPGGSSGGSAAAVAARMAPISIGTDTGGSIRQPASFCGTVGVKPTYGRVSRYGIVAFASSLDQAGPFSNSVQDSALVSQIISGQDEFDGTTSDKPVPQWLEKLQASPLKSLAGMKVGLPKEYFKDGIQPDVRRVVDEAVKLIKDLGAETVEVSLPHSEHAVAIYYLIATSEASSNLARYDGVRYGYRADFSKEPAKDLLDFYCRSRGEGFGSEVKRRIMLGTYCLSSGYYDAYYKKACQVRRLLKESFSKAFSQCDVLVSPVTTTTAFKIGERIDDPLTMYMNDIFTTSSNLVGIPSMSLPAGFSADKMPIGVQIYAEQFQEEKMFMLADCLERSLNLKGQVPNGK